MSSLSWFTLGNASFTNVCFSTCLSQYCTTGSDLEGYFLTKFDHSWCQVWADLGLAKRFMRRLSRDPSVPIMLISGLLFGPIWPKVLSPLTRFRLGSAFFCQPIGTWPFWANNACQLRFPRLLFDHVFRNTAFKLWLSRLLLDYIFPSTAFRQLLEFIFLILPLSSTFQCYCRVNFNQIHVQIYFDLGCNAFFQIIVVWPFWTNNASQLIFPRQLFDQLWPMFFPVLPFILNVTRHLFSFSCLSASIYKATTLNTYF